MQINTSELGSHLEPKATKAEEKARLRGLFGWENSDEVSTASGAVGQLAQEGAVLDFYYRALLTR